MSVNTNRFAGFPVLMYSRSSVRLALTLFLFLRPTGNQELLSAKVPTYGRRFDRTMTGSIESFRQVRTSCAMVTARCNPSPPRAAHYSDDRVCLGLTVVGVAHRPAAPSDLAVQARPLCSRLFLVTGFVVTREPCLASTLPSGVAASAPTAGVLHSTP